MAGWPRPTPSLPIAARVPARVRILVPEILPPDRPALPIRTEAGRSVGDRGGTTAYRLAPPPWIGLLVDIYG